MPNGVRDPRETLTPHIFNQAKTSGHHFVPQYFYRSCGIGGSKKTMLNCYDGKTSEIQAAIEFLQTYFRIRTI